MQKRQGGFLFDPAIAVSRARADALKEPQYRPYGFDGVQSRHQRQFRGSRIGETNVHARRRRRLQYDFRTGQDLPPCQMFCTIIA
jgi:hypothetical protein